MPGEHISPVEAELAALQERLEEAERILVDVANWFGLPHNGDKKRPESTEMFDDIREFLNQ